MSSQKERSHGEIGLRLAYLRKRAGLTQTEVAEKLGLGCESVSKIERGTAGVSVQRAEALAQILDSSPEWILWGKVVQYTGNEPVREVGPIYSVGEAWALPIIGRVLGDDTGGRLVDVEHALGTMNVSRDACLAQVLGGSLAPVARPGQHLLLDSAERSARDGDLVVVETHDGRVLGKRFHEDDTGYVLAAVNPVDTQMPIRLSPADVKSIRVVIGVLFE